MGDKIGVVSNVVTTTDNGTGLEFKIWIPIKPNQIHFAESINNELTGVNFRNLPHGEINAQPQEEGGHSNAQNRPRIQYSAPADQILPHREQSFYRADPVERAETPQEQGGHSNPLTYPTEEPEGHSNPITYQPIKKYPQWSADYQRTPSGSDGGSSEMLQASIPADKIGSNREEEISENDDHESPKHRLQGRAHIADKALEYEMIEDAELERPRHRVQGRAHIGDQALKYGRCQIADKALEQETTEDDDLEGPRHRLQGRAHIADKALEYDSKVPRKQIVKGHAKEQQTQQNDHVSIHINNLVDSMKEKLKILRPVSDSICIYRVSDELRDLNEKAYTPHTVSIGPFHYGKENLALMEDEKIRYVERFLLRSNISMEELFKETLEMEPRLRNSYAEKIYYISRTFVTMVLVDGVFILEYLIRRHHRDWESNDPIFNKQRMTNTIRFDLLLLENQVPFFFIDHLFRLSKKPEIRSLSMIKLVRRFLEESTGWDWLVKDSYNDDNQIDPQHIIDFLSINLLPPKPQQGQELKVRTSPSIFELHGAGVKFRSTSKRHFLDIEFKNGILEIPTWKINDRTEILFRNLLAYEQCNPPHHYLSDYIAFMDMLINVDQDVELLVRNGIIENLLQDNQSVADLVNNLSKNNVIYDKDFYFSGLVGELKSYCERPWHKWKANLKQEYFKNPWTIISVIAAVFLLLLTILQSVCSVLQVL
ncbi:UPF0481 protein At3g47200-like isoform X3 [Euphorbia lathyris]|uniref:UPF0481 protein At3g47200-like isoform X3 n=1 Tax=Euphorbia lathyris TaxID=212925 RepID=UPI0033139F62